MTNKATNCINCNTPLSGKYCNSCGEKVIEKSDFSIKHILNQSIGALFSIDSKLFRSLYYLLLKPGKLSLEYVEGRRVKLMKPFQLFVVSNLLFFILMSDSDIFRIPSNYYFNQTTISPKIDEISKISKMSHKEIALEYDESSLSWSKTALVLTIPFIGILMAIISFNNRFYLGMHLIFATHFMSFFLITLSILGIFNAVLIDIIKSYNLKIPIMLSLFVYATWSIKVFYGDKLWIAILKGGLSTVAIIGVLILYRNLISSFSLYLI